MKIIILAGGLGDLSFCLKALMNKSFVKLANLPNSKQKFKYAVILYSCGIMEKILITGQLVKRKLLEYDAFRTAIDIPKADVDDRDPQTQKVQKV